MRGAEMELDQASGAVVPQDAKLSPETPDPPRRRFVRKAVMVGLVGLVVAASLGTTLSPIFRLDNLRVTGTSHLSASQVIDAAGLARGANVFWLDTGGVERRLESLNWVASAQVKKTLPGTITIAIHERSPVGAVDRSGTFDLVAGDGTVLAAVGGDPKLPRIEVRTIPGGPVAGSYVGPAELLAAVPIDVRAEIESVALADDGELTGQTRTGAVLMLGPPVDLAAKGIALAAVLRWARDRGVHLVEIDLRTPTAPSARLAGGGPARF